MKRICQLSLSVRCALRGVAGWLLIGLACPAALAQSHFIERNFHVRIAVKHEVTHLAVQGTNAYQVVSSAGKPLVNLNPNEPYFVQITRGRPGDKTYRLVLREMNAHQVREAISLAKSTKENFQTPVKVLRIPSPNPDETRILVTAGEYASLSSARSAIARFKGETIRYIYEDRARAKEGQVRLMGRDGSIVAADERFLRLVPFNLADDALALRELESNDCSPSAMQNSRSYRGEMELTINEEGTLTAVNDLWIEYYLYSVVGAEIGDDAPDDALKAQAVAARSEAVAKIQRGIVSSSLFDFYATPICQCYPGKNEETQRVRDAVDATRGEILIYHGEAVDAVYSHCCGGVTASSQDVWDGVGEDYATCVVDRLSDTAAPDLTNWATAHAWTSRPLDVLCNPNQPGYPAYGKKYFQWERVYSGEEFSRVADKMYGTGQVRDILVDRRTPSGRVRKLKIIGENKTVSVHRELELRQALGDIYSNFFTFVKEHDKSGRLSRIIINGAGYGHGVGMCQMGAFIMATQGYNYRQILAHYFKEVRIRRLYR